MLHRDTSGEDEREGRRVKRGYANSLQGTFCAIATSALKCNSLFTFRPGFYVQQLTRVPEGTYDVIPSTFYPGQEGPFILTIAASCKIALARK